MTWWSLARFYSQNVLSLGLLYVAISKNNVDLKDQLSVMSSDQLWAVISYFFSKKKKGGVHSEISLCRDDAWFCGGMIGTECWRRDGAIADSSSFSIFQMFSTISSINSDSRLQMQAKPQLFFLKNRVSDQLIIQ